jgi:phosphate transport system substrate-binding protein
MRLRLLACVPIALALGAGCGGGREGGDAVPATGRSDLSGRIEADGSSTVGPFTTAAAERFQRQNPNVQITVGVSGTGGGFERFCRDETDLSNASRPVKDEETFVCDQRGIEFVEFQVANDALTVVVNRENDWADCLKVAELKKIWAPGSKVSNWNQVRSSFPDEPLVLAGPGTDSGTFDYFTDAIVGKEGASRTDYSPSEDDNVIVQGVAGEKGGLGYLGFSYFEENQNKLRALEIDGGGGCVAPSPAAAQSGKYEPLSRPLFVYVKKSAFEQKSVEDFVKYILDNEKQIAAKADFISLNQEQLAKARADYQQALAEVKG